MRASREDFILSALSFHDNPYDGHTLRETLTQAERKEFTHYL